MIDEVTQMDKKVGKWTKSHKSCVEFGQVVMRWRFLRLVELSPERVVRWGV